MPKDARYKKAIPRLYRRGHLETTLFTWVICSKNYFPTLSVENALLEWYKVFDINPDDYPMTTATQTFARMQKELIYKEKDEKDNKLD
jgi:hypothetical protein